VLLLEELPTIICSIALVELSETGMEDLFQEIRKTHYKIEWFLPQSSKHLMAKAHSRLEQGYQYPSK
jgi:hypothetical protein